MIYIDTMILIYLIEDDPVYGAGVDGEFAQLVAQEEMFLSSALMVTEFVAGVKQDVQTSLEVLAKIQRLGLVDMNESIAIQAGLLQRRHKLKIGDAIHLATCLESVCDTIFTNDSQLAVTAANYCKVLKPTAAC